MKLRRGAESNVISYGGGGAPTTIISGLLSFDAVSLKPITQLLPSLILVKADQAAPSRCTPLFNCLRLKWRNKHPDQKSRQIVWQKFCSSKLFPPTLRRTASGDGYLPFSTHSLEPQVRSIHENVNSPWTVELLAAAAGMSRSAFALRFKEVLGRAPLDYVTEWRMQKAMPLLQKWK